MEYTSFNLAQENELYDELKEKMVDVDSSDTPESIYDQAYSLAYDLIIDNLYNGLEPRNSAVVQTIANDAAGLTERWMDEFIDMSEDDYNFA